MEQLRLPYTEICTGCKRLIKEQPEIIPSIMEGIKGAPICKECFFIYRRTRDSKLYWEVFNNVIDKLQDNFRKSFDRNPGD